MTGLANSVRWIWGISVAIQAVIFFVLFFKGYFRKLPFFTGFVAANICQAVFIYIVYVQLGSKSRTAKWVTWLSEPAILILRTLATTEVLRLILKAYRGIWGLVWRVVLVGFGGVLLYAAIESMRNVPWALAVAYRGFHLAYAVSLVAGLLLIRYYSIPFEPLYKVILAGFCFYSCTIVLANTVGQWVFLRGFLNYQPIWQFAITAIYAGIQVAWAVELWKTAPSEESRPRLLTSSLYQQISPQINERLYALNEQLSQFWRPRATRP
jgi:hypothetical protein